MSSEQTPGHLFVLVHGLWGGPKHLLLLDEAIRTSVKGLEKVYTLRPSSFAFFKTYDGIKVCGEKVVRDIFYEIETLQKENVHITKISIVGYSLGGLISRYAIGRLNELNAFDHIEPVFFSTFATPHVGVCFFKDTIADRVTNWTASTLLGQTGRDLFIKQSSILVDLADPNQPYYQGLAKFKKRILLANARNDRTVAFYTAYITEYAPFQHWSEVQLRFYPDLPDIAVGKRRFRPRVIDFEKSDFKQSASGFFASPSRMLKFAALVILAAVVVPLYAPMVITASLVGTCLAYLRLCFTPHPDNTEHWRKVRESVYENQRPLSAGSVAQGQSNRSENRAADQEPDQPAEFTQEAFDTLLAIESIGSDEEEGFADETHSLVPSTGHTPVSIDYASNAPRIAKFLTRVETAGKSRSFPLFSEENLLPCDNDRLFIIRSLNRLKWTKIPVFIDAWNAHDGVVARRGPRSNPRGASTVYLWASIIRHEVEAR